MADGRLFLLTGGTGTIGGALARRLIAGGGRVRILTLPGDLKAPEFEGMEGIELRYGDIADPEAVNGICEGVTTVVHLAAVVLSDDDLVFDRVNVNGTRYLLTDARNCGVNHFVHISSASVTYRKMTPYSRSKRIAERYVRDAAVSWTIIRPTLVYGEEGGMEFDRFVDYLASWPVVPFIGSGKALKRPVYVGDLVDGITRVALLEHGSGKIYNLSGGSSISMVDFARLCLTLLGKEDKIIIHVPVLLCRVIAALMQRWMKKPLLRWNMIAGVIQNANLDPQEAVTDLGYVPAPVEKKLGECFPGKRRSSISLHRRCFQA
ncbi:MAG: NAD-dependent epimerase/dehydratase family protein [Chitinispirillaceae bacterium]|nr:NAD-dependent epimerase/dehydratase family protein [Chitinispirillaceae bacterium]